MHVSLLRVKEFEDANDRGQVRRAFLRLEMMNKIVNHSPLDQIVLAFLLHTLFEHTATRAAVPNPAGLGRFGTQSVT